MIFDGIALMFALAALAFGATALTHIANRLIWLVADVRRRTLDLSTAAVFTALGFVCFMFARVALSVGGSSL